MSRPRKQLLLKLGVFLLLGAIVNVAVGMIFVQLNGGRTLPKINSADFTNHRSPTAEEDRWTCENMLPLIAKILGETPTCGTRTAHESLRIGWRRTGIEQEYFLPSRRGSKSSITVAGNSIPAVNAGKYSVSMSKRVDCGWPSYSVRVDLVLATTTGQPFRYEEFRPIWPGFAINTIFYAAMLWLLWFAPGKIKRFIRVHRGRCPACGFIIAPGTAAASGGPCSECGHLLTR
jgi:hypothetical protein